MKTISQIRLLAGTAMALVPAVALAQLTPVNPPAGTAQGSLGNALYTLVNIFLALAGVVAVIMIIYGGVQYIISRGDDSNVERAKNIILYSVIGLIVIGLAAAVVNFTIGAILRA